MTRRVFHYDRTLERMVEGPHPGNMRSEPPRKVKRGGADGGISFQFPPDWDDGSGKVKHVPDGPFKGRVCFESRRDAVEVAKRYEGMCGQKIHYDP